MNRTKRSLADLVETFWGCVLSCWFAASPSFNRICPTSDAKCILCTSSLWISAQFEHLSWLFTYIIIKSDHRMPVNYLNFNFRFSFFYCRQIIIGMVSVGVLGAIATSRSLISCWKSGCEYIRWTNAWRWLMFNHIGDATIVSHTRRCSESPTKNRFR